MRWVLLSIVDVCCWMYAATAADAASQDGPISEHLHLMDAPEFNGYNMWALYEGSKHGPQHFNGGVDSCCWFVSNWTAMAPMCGVQLHY
jgi:hypothetical protein